MRSSQKTLAMWAIIAVVAFVMFQMYETGQQTKVRDFKYPEFIKALNANQIAKVTLHQDSGEISGEIKNEFKEEYKNALKFQFDSEVSPEMRQMIEAKGIIPSFEKSENSALTGFLMNYLPVILIFIIVLFLLRQFQSSGGKAMSFGKSRARLLVENKKKVTFKDVAGVEEGKEELKEVVSFLKNPKKFTRLGGRIPKGVLLWWEALVQAKPCWHVLWRVKPMCHFILFLGQTLLRCLSVWEPVAFATFLNKEKRTPRVSYLLTRLMPLADIVGLEWVEVTMSASKP